MNVGTEKSVNNVTEPQAKMERAVLAQIKNKTVGGRALPSLKSGARPVK